MRTVLLASLTLSLSMMAQPVLADFSNNGDGTVTDQGSNLMWQRCSAPSTETDCATSTPSLYNWDNALAYCNSLSLASNTDWRVPNIKELHSILDASTSSEPAIDTPSFPDTQATYYWSSTTFAGTNGYAWYVDFGIGLSGFVMTSPISKTNGEYVRCVRGG